MVIASGALLATGVPRVEEFAAIAFAGRQAGDEAGARKSLSAVMRIADKLG